MNILVVDDDAMQRNVLAKYLTKLGYNVLQAVDGREGLAVIEKKNANIALVDWMMPEMDGIEFCKKIRAKKMQDYVYLIMLTSKGEKEDLMTGYDAGVDSFIKKPPDLDELEALIKVGARITGERAVPSPPEESKTVSDNDAESDALKSQPIKNEKKKIDLPLIGRIALDRKLINRKQLAKALSVREEQKQAGKDVHLEEIFLQTGMISEAIMDKLVVVTAREYGKKFGDIVIKKGLAAKEEIDKALAIQAKEFKETQACRLLGNILVDEGVLTSEQRDSIMAGQKRYESPATNLEKGTGKDLTGAAHVQDSMTQASSCEQEPDKETDLQKESELRLTVTEDKNQAHLSISAGAPKSFSIDDVRHLLDEEGITYQIVDDAVLNEFLNSGPTVEDNLVVAQGTPAVAGKDADIKYHFERDYLRVGTIHGDGVIDYKDRGEVPVVKAGDLLAEKIPAQNGKDGTDVYGKTVYAPIPEDLQLISESGVEISEDGMQVVAKIDGQPNATVGGKFAVFSEFIVKGDVDYDTGNIEFDGSIVVKGTIKDGFSVKGGNLTAKEIMGADIHVKGDVISSGGILGASIQAEGQVKAKFITDSNIKAYGNVIVIKEIMDSKIRTSGECDAQRGKIISSLVAAKQGIEVKEIGTDVSEPCTIMIGGDEHIRKIIQGFEDAGADLKKLIEKDQTVYDKLLKQQQHIHKTIADIAQKQELGAVKQRNLKEQIEEFKKSGNKKEVVKLEKKLSRVAENIQALEQRVAEQFEIQDKQEQIIAELQDNIEPMINKIEELNLSKVSVKKWAGKDTGLALLKATGAIFPGTKIIGPNSALRLEKTIRNISIKEVKQLGRDWEMEVIKR